MHRIALQFILPIQPKKVNIFSGGRAENKAAAEKNISCCEESEADAMKPQKKRADKRRKPDIPPLGATMQIYEVDHVDASGTPQRTDRAVESGHDWVEFTQL